MVSVSAPVTRSRTVTNLGLPRYATSGHAQEWRGTRGPRVGPIAADFHEQEGPHGWVSSPA
jgi:hypothetical protein